MKKKISVSALFLFPAFVILSQDVHFTQYNETPQLINPASAGVYNGTVRAIINYRNQWMAMGKAYTTSAASIDFPIGYKKETKSYMGVGLNFFSDKAGDSKFGKTQANLCLDGVIPVTRTSKFSLGISVGGGQHKANLASLQWGNQYDGTGFDLNIPSNELAPVNSYFFADIGAGIYYEYFSGKEAMERNEQKRLSIGFSAFHLNRPTETYFTVSEKLYMKFVGNLNGHFDVEGTRFSVLPTAAVFFQGKSREYNVGASLRYRIRNGTKITGFFSESGISLGVNYRVGDAFSPTVAYQIGNLYIGFAYDYSTSSYSNTNKHFGSIEAYLKFNIIKGAVWDSK